jgi:DNA-binding NarL/FixJ family response regulator
MELKSYVLSICDNPNLELKDELEESVKACFYVAGMEDAKNIFDHFKVDVVFVNFDEEQKDKLSVIKYLQTRDPDFPIFVATSEGEKVKKFLQNYNISGFISSPISKEEILNAIGEKKEIIDKFAQKNHEDTTLTKSLSIQESIDEFFKKTLEDLLLMQEEDFGTKKMNYELMKRFLFTAYNNMMEIDYSLEDKELKRVRVNFESAIKMKNDFENRIRDTIEGNYEKIYLKKNTEYLALYNEHDDIVMKLGSLRNELGLLTRQLDEVKEKRKFLKKDSPEGQKNDEDFKRINGKHVDRVHEITTLKERINEVDKGMEELRKKYFEEFKSAFIDSVESVRYDLKEVLDILAYRFDKVMWRRAKGSRNIRDFFKDAQIKGVMSSKTYLQYYTNGIDESMASPQSKKLIKYINQYNSTNKKLIALVGENVEAISREKEIISSVDPILEGRYYKDVAEFLRQFSGSDFEAVIMDAVVGKKRGIEIIDFLKKKFPSQSEATVYALRMKSKNDSKNYTIGFNRGIKYFFYEDMGREEFMDIIVKMV